MQKTCKVQPIAVQGMKNAMPCHLSNPVRVEYSQGSKLTASSLLCNTPQIPCRLQLGDSLVHWLSIHNTLQQRKGALKPASDVIIVAQMNAANPAELTLKPCLTADAFLGALVPACIHNNFEQIEIKSSLRCACHHWCAEKQSDDLAHSIMHGTQLKRSGSGSRHQYFRVQRGEHALSQGTYTPAVVLLVPILPYTCPSLLAGVSCPGQGYSKPWR